MPVVGLGLELDKALQQAAKLDNYYDKWLNVSATISANMATAMSSAQGMGAGMTAELGNLKSFVESMKGVSTFKVDDSGFQKIAGVIDVIAKGVDGITKVMGKDFRFFNVNDFNVAGEGVLSLTTQLMAVEDQLAKVKEKYSALIVEAQKAHNEGDKEGFAKNMAAAQDADYEYKALMNKQARLQASLNFAKKTESEQTEFVMKQVEKREKTELRSINKLRKDYADLYRDLRSTVAARGTYDQRMAEGRQFSKSDTEKYSALIAQETKLRMQIEDMELKHLQHISDLRIRFATQDAKAAAEAMKSAQYSPQEALKMASNARTGNQKELAKVAVQQALMNVDESDTKTIEALNKAYIKLRAGIESLTKAQKNQQTLQPTLRNEYARTLKEMSSLKDAMDRLKSTGAYKGNEGAAAQKAAQAEFNAMEAHYKDLEARKLQLKQQSGALLAEVERKHESDLAQAKVKEYEKAEKKKQEIQKKYAAMSSSDVKAVISKYGDPENVRQAQLAIEKLTEARDKLSHKDAKYKETLAEVNAALAQNREYIDEVTRAENKKNATAVTKDEAMKYSRNAKSVKELKDAIKMLEEARSKEDLNTKKGKKNYTELTMEIERQKATYQKLAAQVQSSSRGMMNTAEQLKRAFATIFSVQQIRGYVRKMMEVRGEFELQHKSLEVLLQDKDKADELWDKTVALAVRSPFRVKDLVTYTKQLAAYRVESHKLYETNKMLADVSSGLGVDMGRLILAYGQVKAANYLRGTELRQFSEAGVNMLDELAKRFSTLEGRVVTVGEVFERVSKRMVSFSDVEAVFKTITSEGGVFYQMQEKQSETLKGMMMNLKDSVDLMMNELGESNEGILKSGVEMVIEFVDNWRHFVTILQEVGVAIALIKLPAFLRMFGSLGTMAYRAAGSIQRVGIASAYMGTSLSRLTVGVSALTKAILHNPLFWGGAVVAALAVATHRIIRYNKEIDETNKQYDALSHREVGRLNNLNELNKKAEGYNKKIKDTSSTLSGLKKGTEEYAQAEHDLAAARKSNEELLNTLKNDYPAIYASIKQNTDGTLELNSAIEAQNRLMAINISLNELMKAGWFESDFAASVKEATAALTEERVALYDVQNAARAASVNLVSLKEDGKIDDSEFATLNEMLGKITKSNDANEMLGFINELKEFVRTKSLPLSIFDGIDEKFNEVRVHSAEESEAWDKLTKKIEGARTAFAAYVLEAKSTDPDNWQTTAAKNITKELESFGVVDEELMRRLQEYIETLDGIGELTWEVTPPEYDEKDLTGWKATVWDAIKKVNTALGRELSENRITFSLQDMFELTDTEIFKQLTEQVKSTTKDIDETIKAGLIPTQVKFTDEQLKAADATKPLIKALADLLAITEKDKGKDTVMEKLKNRISLIKEMNKEYERLAKTYSKTEATQKVRSSFADSAKQLGLDTSKMDFSDAGSLASLEKLLGDPKYAGKKYALELKKAIDNYKIEIGIVEKEAEVQKMFDRVQSMFDEYNLALELKNMDISPELAKKVGDVDYLSLGKLKENVVKEFSGTSEEVKRILSKDFDAISASEWLTVADLTSEDEMKEAKKRLEEISKMEDKEVRERFKKYVEYAKISIGERAKIKLEELKKLKEIEETFKIDEEKDDAETKQFKRDMAERARNNVKKESQEAMNKVDWETFEKSDTFVRIFDDLEGASVSMLTTTVKKLEDFKTQWKDMPLEDVNKIIDKINELEAALINLTPGKMWTEGRDEFNKFYNEVVSGKGKDSEGRAFFEGDEAKKTFEKGGKANFYKAVEEETVYQEGEKEKALEQIALLEVVMRIKEGIAMEEEKLLATEEDYAPLLKMDISYLKTQHTTQQGIVKNADRILARNQDITNAKQKQISALRKTSDYMGEVMGMANDLYGAFKELSVALGADEDSPAFIFAEMGMNILSSIPSMLALIAQIQAATVAAQGLGTAMNMAMGIIGLIVMAVQLIAQVISAAVNHAEEVKQNKIDVMVKQVENLEKAYEKLSEAAEKAWSIEQLRKYSAELGNINQKAIDVQESLVALLEEDKQVKAGIAAEEKLAKGKPLTDKERKALLNEEYQEYKEAVEKVEELKKKHEESKQSLLEEVGTVTDYRDTTRDFVDAWVDAFKETGDGLSGLQENFSEFFDNIIKEQATMRVVDKFLAPLYDSINKSLEDYELTTEESKALREQAEKIAPELNAALEEIWKQLGGSNGESGVQLSELQKGIQGVTEETAQVLEALLNSMRFYVADSNAELKNQTRLLGDIYSLLNNMTDIMPAGKSGRGIKVVM